MTNDNLQKYEYGALAGRFLKGENIEGAKVALKKLARNLGLYDEGEGFVEGAFVSEKGIQTAAGIYAKKYNDALSGATIGELADYYNSVLSSIGDDANPIRDELSKFADVSYKDLTTKLGKADWLIKGKDYGISEDEIKSAKETQKEYAGVSTSLKVLSEFYMSGKEYEITKDLQKDALKGLAKKLSEAESE